MLLHFPKRVLELLLLGPAVAPCEQCLRVFEITLSLPIQPLGTEQVAVAPACGGAVSAGFMLGILQSFASMNEVKSILPGIDQIIIYLIAVIILLVRPRGLMGRKGVMEH